MSPSSLSIAASVSLLFSQAMAQAQYSILQYSSSALPDCAKGCTILNNAAGSCLPPAAPVTQVEIYKSCFCQSALLVSLYSSPYGICDSVCTVPSDLEKVRSWYSSWCTGPSLPLSSGSTPSSSSAAATKGKATTTPTPTRAPSSQQPTPSWISGHWRYVILIVILVLLIGGGAIFAVWYKKRRRAQAAAAAQESNAPVVWGPFQAQHHTDGFNYVDSYEAMPVPPPISEKGRKGTASSTVREPPQSADSLVPEQSRWSDGSNKWWKRER